MVLRIVIPAQAGIQDYGQYGEILEILCVTPTHCTDQQRKFIRSLRCPAHLVKNLGN